MTLPKLLILILILQFVSPKVVDVTFKNVTFNGYQTFTPRFKATILFGNSLKNFIPNKDFDNIEFLDQHIPILYRDTIADINGLTELDMEFCEIREIRPGAFKNLSHLSRVSLKMNKLETIQNHVFNNLSISTLDLSFNQISSINKEAFDNMPELYHINLAFNLLSAWDSEWFKNTPKLSVFNFKNNFIEELKAHSFQNLKMNRFLNFDLIFTHNRISRIDENAFADLQQISLLSLGNNLLKSFDNQILKNVHVNDLRLNNNSITCFDEDFDETFKATYNYIEYNPLECDCLKKIKKWSKTNNKDVGVEDTKCQEDEEKLHGVVNIEDVKEVAKDVYAIQHITLVF